MSPDWSEQDIAGMRAALAEAELAADAGEIPVGAVVVVNGETAIPPISWPIET